MDGLGVLILFDHLRSLLSLKTLADALSLLAHVIGFELILAGMTVTSIDSNMRTGVVEPFILDHFHESSLGHVQ